MKKNWRIKPYKIYNYYDFVIFAVLSMFYKKCTIMVSTCFCVFFMVHVSTYGFSHEIRIKDLVIYHPSLFVEKRKTAEAFFSIYNEGLESEYIVGISSQFSKCIELYSFNNQIEKSEQIGFSCDKFLDLSDNSLEIKSEEAITFDSLEYMLLFTGINESLNWFDTHQATISFKDSGYVKLEFEVEHEE